MLRRRHAHPWIVIARPYSNKLEEHAGLRGNLNGFLCLLSTGWFAIRDELNQCWVGLIRGLHHQIPHGTGVPLAPYVPGTLADGVLYVSGTLPFDKDNNVVHVGDAATGARRWPPTSLM